MSGHDAHRLLHPSCRLRLPRNSCPHRALPAHVKGIPAGRTLPAGSRVHRHRAADDLVTADDGRRCLPGCKCIYCGCDVLHRGIIQRVVRNVYSLVSHCIQLRMVFTEPCAHRNSPIYVRVRCGQAVTKQSCETFLYLSILGLSPVRTWNLCLCSNVQSARLRGLFLLVDVFAPQLLVSEAAPAR